MPANVRLAGPLSYLDMLRPMAGTRILADSGGARKEACMLSVPCVTLRETAERVETVHDGWNVLARAEREAIVRAVRSGDPVAPRSTLYGTRGERADRRHARGRPVPVSPLEEVRVPRVTAAVGTPVRAAVNGAVRAGSRPVGPSGCGAGAHPSPVDPGSTPEMPAFRAYFDEN